VSFADANQSSIRIIEESSWGTTPSSGASREVRLTSSSLSAQKETVVSDELRADRMVSTITEVAAMSSGDINFEFSAGATDEFLAAFVMGAWTRPMTMDFWKGRIVSITDTDTVTVAGRDLTSYLSAGRRIKLDGFANGQNIGYFEIDSVAFTAGNTVITTTTSTLAAETGSVTGVLTDANDVVVLGSTDIESTATGFSSGGDNVFAPAISAGQIVTGQKIFVDGLGHETGTITLDAATLDAEDLVVTVSDGAVSKTLTYGTDIVATTVNDLANEIAAAINAQRSENPAMAIKAVVTDNGSDRVVTVTNLNSTGGALTETAAATDGVTIVNFSGGGTKLGGVYTVLSVSADVITTSPAPSRVLAAGDAVTVKASMLRNPGDVSTINQRQFSIETGFNNVSQFMVQDGMVPGTFSLEIATGAIITGTVGFEGRSTRLAQATVLADTSSYDVLEAPAGEVANATTNVGSVTKDGSDFSACIQSISVSGEANLRQQACVGSKFSRGIGAGRFNLTGSMAVFFEDESLFNDFINHETVALSFAINDAEGTSYIFTVPSTKFSQDEIAPGGIDQDVIENMEFTAFRDPATNCMLQVDRFSPTAAV